MFGTKSYVHNESCIRIGPRPAISMDTMYADVLALGRIFGVLPRAEAMVADFRSRVAAVTARTANAKIRYRVMYCGDCDADAAPLTIGAEGMPTLLATLAGGQTSTTSPNWHQARYRGTPSSHEIPNGLLFPITAFRPIASRPT